MLIPLTGPFLVTIAGLLASAGGVEIAPTSTTAKVTMIERTTSRESSNLLRCTNIDASSLECARRSVTLYDGEIVGSGTQRLGFSIPRLRLPPLIPSDQVSETVWVPS